MDSSDRTVGVSRRERLRRELIDEIVETGRRQLEVGGISAVSWRAIAREIGMNPASLYTYFDGVEELYTHILLRCFQRLADAVTDAAHTAGPDGPRERLLACAQAFRRWALDHPREFNLIYTDQIPGYAAPADGPTLTAALAVEQPFADAIAELLGLAGTVDLRDGSGPGEDRTDELAERIYALRALLHGFVSLEVNHHAPYLRGSDETMVRALTRALDELTDRLGPTPRSGTGSRPDRA